jgi:hypothetical protein
VSTFFTLEDGRAWLSSNGAYDGIIEAIAEVLRAADEQELASWLLDQRCVVQGPGVGTLDLRELTIDNRQRILDSLPKALALSKERTPTQLWVAEFERLLMMVKDPTLLDKNVRGIIPYDGTKSGPGW